jgi:hypothetical protein
MEHGLCGITSYLFLLPSTSLAFNCHKVLELIKLLPALPSATPPEMHHIFFLGGYSSAPICIGSGFGGLGVSMLASGTQDRGFAPG